MELTEQQIVDNWNKLLDIIKTELTGKKQENLLRLHLYFEDRMSLAPASAMEHFHNAFPGGYVAHILNVIACAKELQVIWEKMGTNVDYTIEELVFSATCHDLGKVGSLDEDYYMPNDSDWHRKNQGAIYKFNPKIHHINVTDRTFMHLAHFNVPYNENEFLAIRTADGMYSELNYGYLKTNSDNFAMKTNLPFIIHAADFLAMHSEYNAWKNEQKGLKNTFVTEPDPAAKKKKATFQDVVKDASAHGKIDLSDFEKLFGEKK